MKRVFSAFVSNTAMGNSCNEMIIHIYSCCAIQTFCSMLSNTMKQSNKRYDHYISVGYCHNHAVQTSQFVGCCSLDFLEVQISVKYLFKCEKAFRMSTLFECKYLEDNFLVQSGDFCIHEYTIRFCKEVCIFPLPQNRYFKKSCAIEEVAVRPNMMADLPILHFRNPWYNSFLENIVCIVLQLFVSAAAVYLWICV